MGRTPRLSRTCPQARFGRMVYAYIDETGDPGNGRKAGASPIFGMGAVLVSDRSAPLLRDAIHQLRADFGVPDNKILSWKDYVRNHDKRAHTARTLAAIPNIKVIYVYSDKARTAGGF